MITDRALGQSQSSLGTFSFWEAVARTGRDEKAPWREWVLTSGKTTRILEKEPS